MGNKNCLLRLGKLRVIVTKKCNLGCLYCHKEGQFSRRKSISPGEFVALTRVACDYGLDEIKYSGGEPLLYAPLVELIRDAKSVGRVPRVSLTTNGILLEERVKELNDGGLDELSISFDTLNVDVFSTLNRGKKKDFCRILSGIEKARSYKWDVSLNMTLTRYNSSEVGHMIDFARERDLVLRLISFIPLSVAPADSVSADASQIFKELKESAVEAVQDPNSPSYTHLRLGNGARVCLVDSSCFSCELCGKSYALRLTTDGKLKPCLISEQVEIDVVTPFRQSDEKQLQERFCQAIAIKKLGLMKYLNVPIKNLSRDVLTEDP